MQPRSLIHPWVSSGMRWGLTGIIGLLSFGGALAQNALPIVVPASERQAYFGGTPSAIQIRVSADNPVSGRLGHTLFLNERSLAVREQELSLSSGESRIVSLPVTFPEVKPGVIYPADLSITFIETGAKPASTNLRIQVWLYASNAFVDQTRLLKELDLGLFDPNEKTVRRFQEAGIPFKIIPRPDALPQSAHQTIVIGEGLNLKDYRGLYPILVELAKQGKQVLLLAPTGGEFAFPTDQPEAVPNPPQSMSFKRAELITEWDKRLDAGDWAPPMDPIASTLCLQGSRAGVGAEILAGNNPAGWPWVEVQWKNRGRLLICGFGLMAQWETNPTPRYLLLRMLENCRPEPGDQNKVTIPSAIDVQSQKGEVK